jgi:hypothetical protein
MKQVVTKEELEKASEVVSGRTYSRKLTADESGALADDIADNEEKLDNLAEEIAGYKAVWKETTKTLKATRKSLISQRKTGHVEEMGNVYIILDPENKTAGEYTAKGLLIKERRMRPEEYQLTIDGPQVRVLPLQAEG